MLLVSFNLIKLEKRDLTTPNCKKATLFGINSHCMWLKAYKHILDISCAHQKLSWYTPVIKNMPANNLVTRALQKQKVRHYSFGAAHICNSHKTHLIFYCMACFQTSNMVILSINWWPPYHFFIPIQRTSFQQSIGKIEVLLQI